MATTFQNIYERAIYRFSDYGFIDIYAERREQIMESWLMSAIADFKNVCVSDLTDYDIEDETFNIDLDMEIQEILALGVAYYWISHKTLSSELLHNTLTRKDYNTYSPANLLKEVRSLRETLRQEYRGKINEYSYRHGTLD